MRKYPWDATDGSPSTAPSGCVHANWSGCAVGTGTSAVASYNGGRSPYGAFDMAGNVWEWVADYYAGTYGSTPVADPEGPATGTDRVVRGGYYGSGAADLRTSERPATPPTEVNYFLGFRCCRALP